MISLKMSREEEERMHAERAKAANEFKFLREVEHRAGVPIEEMLKELRWCRAGGSPGDALRWFQRILQGGKK